VLPLAAVDGAAGVVLLLEHPVTSVAVTIAANNHCRAIQAS
jgi:hypothetical protein